MFDKVRVFFSDGSECVIHVRQGDDIQEEIAAQFDGETHEITNYRIEGTYTPGFNKWEGGGVIYVPPQNDRLIALQYPHMLSGQLVEALVAKHQAA